MQLCACRASPSCSVKHCRLIVWAQQPLRTHGVICSTLNNESSHCTLHQIDWFVITSLVVILSANTPVLVWFIVVIFWPVHTDHSHSAELGLPCSNWCSHSLSRLALIFVTHLGLVPYLSPSICSADAVVQSCETSRQEEVGISAELDAHLRALVCETKLIFMGTKCLTANSTHF